MRPIVPDVVRKLTAPAQVAASRFPVGVNLNCRPSGSRIIAPRRTPSRSSSTPSVSWGAKVDPKRVAAVRRRGAAVPGHGVRALRDKIVLGQVLLSARLQLAGRPPKVVRRTITPPRPSGGTRVVADRAARTARQASSSVGASRLVVVERERDEPSRKRIASSLSAPSRTSRTARARGRSPWPRLGPRLARRRPARLHAREPLQHRLFRCSSRESRTASPAPSSTGPAFARTCEASARLPHRRHGHRGHRHRRRSDGRRPAARRLELFGAVRHRRRGHDERSDLAHARPLERLRKPAARRPARAAPAPPA